MPVCRRHRQHQHEKIRARATILAARRSAHCIRARSPHPDANGCGRSPACGSRRRGARSPGRCGPCRECPACGRALRCRAQAERRALPAGPRADSARPSPTRRAVASISAQAKSADASLSTSGVFVATMPACSERGEIEIVVADAADWRPRAAAAPCAIALASTGSATPSTAPWLVAQFLRHLLAASTHDLRLRPDLEIFAQADR